MRHERTCHTMSTCDRGAWYTVDMNTINPKPTDPTPPPAPTFGDRPPDGGLAPKPAPEPQPPPVEE